MMTDGEEFLGFYENLRTLLRNGAYGTVDLWRCRLSHEHRAIKSTHLQEGRDVFEWEREQQALHIAAQSSDPDARNIVRLYASCITNTVAVAPSGKCAPPAAPCLLRQPTIRLGYLVLEHCDFSLMQFMRLHSRDKPLPQTLQWSGQLFSGLTFMHSKGIIHRDLNPNNTMLMQTGHACWDLKISDFGLSHTQADIMIAAVETLSYRAPEILFGALTEKAGLPKLLAAEQQNTPALTPSMFCMRCWLCLLFLLSEQVADWTQRRAKHRQETNEQQTTQTSRNQT